MASIHLNGQPMELPEPTTIHELVSRYPISPSSILVERNQEALPRSEWGETTIRENDRIEFIRVVAGG